MRDSPSNPSSLPRTKTMLKKTPIIFVFVLLMIFPVALLSQIRQPGTKGSTPGRNEVIAIETIKELYAAQAMYFHQNPFQPSYFGRLEDLANAGLIDADLGNGYRAGYRFSMQPTPGSVFSPATFLLHVWPVEYRTTGRRSFFMTSDCNVHGSDRMGDFSGYNDPVIDQCAPTLAASFDESTKGFLRSVASAQETYAATVGSGMYGSIEQLYQAGLVDEMFYTAPIRHWHVYQVVTVARTATEPAKFKIWATPGRYRESGLVSYYIDQTGVMRGADRAGAMAHEDDPPILENERQEK